MKWNITQVTHTHNNVSDERHIDTERREGGQEEEQNIPFLRDFSLSVHTYFCMYYTCLSVSPAERFLILFSLWSRIQWKRIYGTKEERAAAAVVDVMRSSSSSSSSTAVCPLAHHIFVEFSGCWLICDNYYYYYCYSCNSFFSAQIQNFLTKRGHVRVLHGITDGWQTKRCRDRRLKRVFGWLVCCRLDRPLAALIRRSKGNWGTDG